MILVQKPKSKPPEQTAPCWGGIENGLFRYKPLDQLHQGSLAISGKGATVSSFRYFLLFLIILPYGKYSY
jgi:hypothetical protein